MSTLFEIFALCVCVCSLDKMFSQEAIVNSHSIIDIEKRVPRMLVSDDRFY